MPLEVGDLIAKLKLDAGQFTTGLKQAGVDTERFGAGLMKIAPAVAAAFVATKVIAWTKEVSRAAEQTQHLSLMTGIAAQRFEEMGVALARVGLTGHDLAFGFRQLARHLVEARDASSEAAAAFDRVGIDPTKIRDGEQALRAIADRFAAMPDGIDKAALAQELFGRSGARLIPILNQGSAGMDALTQKSREFGLVLSEVQREGLTRFDDALDDLGKSLEGFKTQVATFVAPAATQGIEALSMASAFATFMVQELSAASTTLTARVANLGTFLVEAAKSGLQVGESAAQTRGSLAALWAALTQETEAVKAATEADKEKARTGDVLAEVEKKLAAVVRGRTATERAQEAAGKGIVEDTQKALLVMQQLGTSFEVAEIMVKGKTATQLEGVVAVARAEQQLGHDLQQIHLREQADIQRIKDLRINAALEAMHKELGVAQEMLEVRKHNALLMMHREIGEGIKEREAEGKAQEALGRHIVEKTKRQFEEVQALAGNVFGAFNQAIDRAVQGVILGTNTMRQAFKQLGQSIVLEFASTVIRQGLKPLQEALGQALFGALQGRGGPQVQGPLRPGETLTAPATALSVQSLSTLAVSALAAAGAVVTFAQALRQSGKSFEKVTTGFGLALGAIVGGATGGLAGAGVGALIGTLGGGLVGSLFGGRGSARLTPQQTGAIVGTAILPGIGTIIGTLIGGFFRSSAGRRRNERDFLQATVTQFKPILEDLGNALTPKALAKGLQELVAEGIPGAAGGVHGFFEVTQLTAQALLEGVGQFKARFITAGQFRTILHSELDPLWQELADALEATVDAIVSKFLQITSQAISQLADMQLEIMALRGGGTEAGLAAFAAATQQAIDAARIVLPLLTDPQEIMQQTQTIRALIQQRYQGEIRLLQTLASTARQAEQAAGAAADAWAGLGANIMDQLAGLRGLAGPQAALDVTQRRFQEAFQAFRNAPTVALGEEVSRLAGPFLAAAQGAFATTSPEFSAIVASLISGLEEVQRVASAQEAAQRTEEARWRMESLGFDARIAAATEGMADSLEALAQELVAMLTEMGFPIPTFQAGTVTVPRTGLALLHRGEMVVPAGVADQMRAGGRSISITVKDNVLLGDSRAMARELARIISPELDAAVSYRMP